MKQVLYINAERTGYGIDQIQNTMTAAELSSYLEQFDEDTPVYLKHDGGHTYGGITWDSFEESEEQDEDDEDEFEEGIQWNGIEFDDEDEDEDEDE